MPAKRVCHLKDVKQRAKMDTKRKQTGIERLQVLSRGQMVLLFLQTV